MIRPARSPSLAAVEGHGGRAARRPLVFTARDRSGALVGLLPLGFELRRVLGRLVGRLAFLGETHIGSDYLDVVARRGQEEAVTRAFAHALRDPGSEPEDPCEAARVSATAVTQREDTTEDEVEYLRRTQGADRVCAEVD